MAASAMDDVDLVLRTMAKTIVDNAVYFAELDGVVGDGDFGYSLRNGFEVVVGDYDTFDRSSVGAVLKKVGFVLSGKVGGVSGPIWGTAFLRASQAAGEKTELTSADVISPLNKLPPQNSGTPTNSLHGKRSPFADTATKHRPPPQGEISHIKRRAVGATMPASTFAKFATTIFLPVCL